MFKPGDKRPENAGRKPGTLNKKTMLLFETLETLRVDPVREIIDLLPALEPKDKVNVYLDLLGYIYPKRKAIEFSEETENKFEHFKDYDVRELIRIAREPHNKPREK